MKETIKSRIIRALANIDDINELTKSNYKVDGKIDQKYIDKIDDCLNMIELQLTLILQKNRGL